MLVSKTSSLYSPIKMFFFRNSEHFDLIPLLEITLLGLKFSHLNE